MDDRKAVERIGKGVGRLVAAMLLASCGCSSDTADPDPFYSGVLAVVNESDRTIITKKWENFGQAMPVNGIVIPDTDKISYFPHLSRFPDSTVASWVFEDDASGTVHTQVIDLTGVVPENTEGTTEFSFGEDGQWTVRFVPE